MHICILSQEYTTYFINSKASGTNILETINKLEGEHRDSEKYVPNLKRTCTKEKFTSLQ